jgi:L-lactate dehydrogenase complex protein LldF
MKAANFIFARPWRFHASQRLARIGLRLFTRRDGWIHSLPSLGAKWTQTRDLRGLPKQTFREWYAARPTNSTSSPSLDPEEMPGAPSMHRHSGAWVGDRKSQSDKSKKEAQ